MMPTVASQNISVYPLWLIRANSQELAHPTTERDCEQFERPQVEARRRLIDHPGELGILHRLLVQTLESLMQFGSRVDACRIHPLAQSPLQALR